MPDQGKSAAWRKMEGCLTQTILPAGYMAGLRTVADCMKDESIRPFLGSALLLQKTGEHPAALADKVCSPGGTTIEGLHRLRTLGFESSVYEAIAAVITKDKSIGG